MTDPSKDQADFQAPLAAPGDERPPLVHISRPAMRRGLAIVLVSVVFAYALSTSGHSELQQIKNNPAAYLASHRETASWSFGEHIVLMVVVVGVVVAAIDGVSGLLTRVIPDSGPARQSFGGTAAAAQVPPTDATGIVTAMPARAAGPQPVVAGLLSLVVPGLGQLYAEAERRAVVAWLATHAVVTVLFILFVRVPGLPTYTCVAVVYVLVTVANVADAARTARHAAAAGPLSRWAPRWPSVVVVGLLLAFGVRPAGLAAMRRTLGNAYYLPSSSMAPGLLAGDRVTSVPIAPVAVSRGAVLAFHSWDGVMLIKRVAGMPGDTIAMRNGTLMLDSRPVQEPYVFADPDISPDTQTGTQFAWQHARVTTAPSAQDYQPTARTWGPLVVPSDSVFVLGDNRENSLDSRDRGFVARSAFFERPTGIYFSRDPISKRIRWERIGIRIK